MVQRRDSFSQPSYVDKEVFQQCVDKITELNSTIEEQSARLRALEAQVGAQVKSSPVARVQPIGQGQELAASEREDQAGQAWPRTLTPTSRTRPRPQEMSPWDMEAQQGETFVVHNSIRSQTHRDVRTQEDGVTYRVNQTPRSGRKAGTKKTVFDKDLVQTICEKPYRRARNRGAMVGGGLLGILSMPFGPIGMAAGSVLGATVGAATGFVMDWRTTTQKLHENEKEIRRLKSFLRWAQDRFHEDEEIIKLIEMVALEFKPIADIAAGSRSARQLLRMLEKWVSQRKVNRNLWRYMEELLKEWKELNRSDFLRSMTVFQILLTMYQYSNRALSEQEAEFVERMRTLLEHESVKLVMTHAHNYPTSGETRVMECMVYADVHGQEMSCQRSSRSVPFLGRRNPTQSFIMSGATGAGVADEVNDQPSDPESSDVEDDAADQQSLKASPRDVGVDESMETQMVLKKPFFKSWQDFMDFDVSTKHQMAITLSEFGLLLEKRDEGLKGWDLCVDRKDIKVAKVQSGEGNITIRAWATLPGIDHIVAFFLFFDIQERLQWDKIFSIMEIIDDRKEGSDVLYSLLKMPGVTQRDFLQYRRARVLEDGSIVIVMRSAEHDKCPEDKRYIRAESFISGYHLQNVGDAENPVLKLFIMSCSDVRGLIPKWIINYMAPKKPAEWVESLKQAAQTYQKKHPDCTTLLLERLEAYKKENMWDYEPLDSVKALTASERERVPE